MSTYYPENLTADTNPDLDQWGFDTYWGPRVWEDWYMLNVKKYGVETARRKWSVAWSEVGFGGAENGWYVDTTFNKFLKENNLLSYTSNPLYHAGGVAVSVGEIIQGIGDAGANVATSASEATDEKQKIPYLSIIFWVAVLWIVASAFSKMARFMPGSNQNKYNNKKMFRR